MIFLDTNYISPMLQEALIHTKMPMYDIVNKQLINESPTSTFELQDNQLVIVNSENAIKVLTDHYAHLNVTRWSNLFKNKVAFRKYLAASFPSFYFKESTLHELSMMDSSTIPYPIILKPAIGYSSVGVQKIKDAQQFTEAVQQLVDNNGLSTSYSKDILNFQTFILETYIEGQELAVDAYFNADGKPVILNLFARMFRDAEDMSDRIYYTSKKVVTQYLQVVEQYLSELGASLDLYNYPFHIELRIDAQGVLIPIEINPLRFAGIGTTELGVHAYDINPYEYVLKQWEPDWSQKIANMDERIYSFTCAEFDSQLTFEDIESIQHEELKQQFEHLLEYRILPQDSGTTFAVIFFVSDSFSQNEHILSLDFMSFVTTKNEVLALSGLQK
ncbi:ATP-grasp domain-containing protein [Metasolibacillus meyeri]|uniref:ATP-grasp domain-containing protein n=1 Tax=Metasolibacillus meyeri TaxID=1071052 RepID=A0AAW9NRR3_9BACL|nr:ATP-grasp domain-containing protein [Metasolibacillus meyeri]MEC1180412.1 ATP-grasp domain-containing protein [Metasolibacillus meyeri]